ncbi:MAG: histidine kinase [Acidobacteriaceae bacterium]|nr:histidine kinase [Acidobacteriaceae bacterium]MBV9499478.1 histidine kinase [Acidobacteriaceae bacterium]
MRSALLRCLREQGIYVLIWTVIGLFFSSQSLTQRAFSRDPTPPSHYLISWAVGSYTWAFLTPVVLWLGRRFPIERRNWARRMALHLLLSLALDLIQLAIEAEILFRIGVFPSVMKSFGMAFGFMLILGFHPNITTYWIILGIQYTFRYYRRYHEREQQALQLELHASELKTQLVRAHLSALKMQLQPHFLFNTLNAIMVLVRQQKALEAEETLARLSDLLRCVLEDVEAQEVPLRRELEYLQLYLAIEQVRFQDRLRVEISADPAILDAAFPHMALQPIVENAIRHGLGRSSSAGRIQISASRRDGILEVKVQDDGPGLPPGSSLTGRGIGLANTRARLAELYGEAGQLIVDNGPQAGAVVTILLPYHVAAVVSETELLEVHAFEDSAG